MTIIIGNLTRKFVLKEKLKAIKKACIRVRFRRSLPERRNFGHGFINITLTLSLVYIGNYFDYF